MNGKFISFVSLFLALILVLPLAAGCGKRESDVGEDSASGEVSSAESELPEPSESDEQSAPSDGEGFDFDMSGLMSGEWSGADISKFFSGGFEYPGGTSNISYPVAIELLVMSLIQDRSTAEYFFESAGFECLITKNFDRSPDDRSHTCAFAAGKGKAVVDGKEREAILVALRGTSGSEWYSNFDFAPGEDKNGVFAENFLRAANDAFDSVEPLINEADDPVIIVCGYSRGAAVANILGMLLNPVYGKKNVSVYTFATPTTVKSDLGMDCGNIFNFVNQSDLVTHLPLEEWGFGRAGVDIVFEGDSAAHEKTQSALSAITSLAPSVDSYYNDKHSLRSGGLSDDGMSAYDAMSIFASLLSSGGIYDYQAAGAMMPDLPQVSQESDLAPVFSLLSRIINSDTDGATQVMAQHMPDVYATHLLSLKRK